MFLVDQVCLRFSYISNLHDEYTITFHAKTEGYHPMLSMRILFIFRLISITLNHIFIKRCRDTMLTIQIETLPLESSQ